MDVKSLKKFCYVYTLMLVRKPIKYSKICKRLSVFRVSVSGYLGNDGFTIAIQIFKQTSLYTVSIPKPLSNPVNKKVSTSKLLSY